MFPEPCSRMLMPLDLAISSPKGIEPSKKAMIGGNQIDMILNRDRFLCGSVVESEQMSTCSAGQIR